MRRHSVFLSRRLSRQRRHPRYHYSHTRRGARGLKKTRNRRSTKRHVRRGGGIGETVEEHGGFPVGKNALVINGKGKIQRVDDIVPALDRTDTQGMPGEDDI